ncbi:hypothetical protein SUH3_23865 [Pseudosulfitobacter pseudonitzschiae]|uniref:SH3b domain-containing protein n=2 Tax=Pseudosulfitobacter pseudonitzschiae TaxID=1402135 RepID=A0A073IZK6_9RHOB|nr:hypothetical protein SUH3_23865 [Pseudosulfitobacter pseudonitzschiae]QKS07662.1 SH3 domain-containing protein [Pseudosulfitobacter pseudonitzschiae]
MMFRFIVLTFLFLGVAFYEMSGGADFDGEALRISRLDPVEPSPIDADTPKTLLADVDTRGAASAEVSRVSLNLTTTRDVIKPTKPLPTTTTASVSTAVASPAQFGGATLSTASLDTTDTNSIVIPSLIPAAQPAIEMSQDELPPTDIMPDEDAIALDVRAVSGNRVNLRGGPGTNFGVVDSLTRGAQVEILQDPGNGWVKLRPLDGGPEGWMADFLLSSS